jgi:hypothetical protein
VKPEAALALLRAASADPLTIAARAREAGKRVVWMLGSDLPYELVEAFGCHPVRLVPDVRVDRSAIDAMVSAETLSERGRALLAAIIALPADDALMISHRDSEQPQIFATLRELARTGAIPVPRVHFLDLLTIDRASTRAYNASRIEQASGWLEGLGDAQAFDRAIRDAAERRRLLREIMALRADARLTGTDAHAILAAAAILPVDDCCDALHALAEGDWPALGGTRILLGGSDIEDIGVIAAIEARGVLVIGEDHGWGEDRAADRPGSLADAALNPPSGPYSDQRARGERLALKAAALGADHVLHLTAIGDEAAPWEVAAIRKALPVPLRTVRLGVEPAPLQQEESAPRARPARSRKSLAAVARFGAYQREWFAGVREAAANGETFACVNANAPQEILRALGIPFVVNQWWASIVAAKQQSPRYAGLLEAHDLPSDVEAYSAQGVAAAFDTDFDLAPWGGLPKPDILGAVLTTDATGPIFEAWADATGAVLQRYERSIESRWEIPIDWWDGLADQWDELLEPERLDLFEADLRTAVTALEGISGRTLDPARLIEVLDLVNEQQGHYRATRDLIARTVPAPISVVDQMPATMVPQWHRGTEWARDAARDFHDEVAARAAAGEAACSNERIRLMFVGRGLWSDMGFYQRWEESHGAVFVCSMYLSLAADGYIRRHDRGRDPMRALAARFVTMGDELRMPTWAGAWHVKEARLHGCDGVVALSDADPLVLRALKQAGFAILELGMDNYIPDPEAEADVDRRVAAFLEGPAAAASAIRHAAMTRLSD